MKYYPEQLVKIKDKDGNFVTGSIMQSADFGNLEDTYWVKYEEVTHQEISIFTESTLDQWNVVLDTHCVCGAKAVGSDKHSNYCSSDLDNQLWL